MHKDPKNIAIALLLLVIIVGGFMFSGGEDVQHVSVEGPDVVSQQATGTTEAPSVTPPSPQASEPAKTPVKTVTGVSTQSPSSIGSGKLAPEFALPTGYANSEPFLLRDLIGKKVIVLSFQNYTTINSLRTLPYFVQWHERYRHKGLAVVTVHTPRFAFDRSKAFVDKEAFRHNVIYPIVLDNQAGIATMWGSNEWPTTYLVDLSGKIVNVYKGEGNYLTIEARIIELLKDRTTRLKLPDNTYFPLETPANAVAVDMVQMKSPETFFGTARNANLGNGTSHLLGIQDMKPFASVVSHTPYLTGTWEFTSDFARASIEKNTLQYRYGARAVYAVLGSEKMHKIRVTLDGAPLGAVAGEDIREEKGQSYLYVTDERVYEVVNADTYGEHLLEMHFENPGVELYALSFG